MSWKKALLVVLVLGFGFVLLVAATIGIAATAAVVSVVDSGVIEPVVDAVEEVTAGSNRLHIELDDESITLTNPDTGRSRVIVPGERIGDGVARWDGPEFTIVDPESGEVRVIVPDFPRVPRVVVNGENHQFYWTTNPFSALGFFFRGLVTLMALGLVATGAYLLLRNRRQESTKAKGDLA
jgi:hypothetical protein